MRFFKGTDTYYQWHEWFAWYPVKVNLGYRKHVWIWGEVVQRRWCMGYEGVITQIRNKDGTSLSYD